EKEGVRQLFGKFNFEFQSLSGTDHFSQLHIVQAGDNWHLSVGRRKLGRNEHRACLKSSFTLQNTWQNRKMGVMPLKNVQRFWNMFVSDNSGWCQLRHIIQPQKRGTMWNELLNSSHIKGQMFWCRHQ